MKNHNALCIVLSTTVLFFYSFGMETPKINKKKIISLITKIKIQQNILGYSPPEEQLCDLHYFRSGLEILATSDPKEERSKTIERLLEERAIPCINQIIYEHLFMEERVLLITKCFHNSSESFLRKTKEHNKEILQKNQLFDYYQQITRKKRAPIQKQPTPLSTPSKQSTTQQTIPLEIKETKSNEIQFTKSTYEGLMYNYQAWLYWTNKNLTCNVNDPFVNIDITAFDEDGNITFHKANFPLPLPILLDDDGIIKKEILLPLSKRPFTVNYKNTEPLQRKLPNMTLEFYKNIRYKEEGEGAKYLTDNEVIEQQGNTYVHGENSCKPLLEKYFKLWRIPENEYKQIQEPLIEPEEQEQPEEPQIGWFARLQAGITTITSSITNFFRNIYRYIFG
jgi:hypothetical protein